MSTPTPTITRNDLDWLCIVHRAAENARENDVVWVESVLAMREAIATFNVIALDEAHAAHAQYLVNRLAALAVTPANAPTTGTPVPVYAERVKDQLMHLATGGYDARALL